MIKRLNTGFILENSLFWSVKMTRSNEPESNDIVVLELDSIHVHNIRCQMVVGVEMLLFLVLI